MKTEFKDLSQQMTYINQFIRRKTNFDRSCVVCGKPGLVQHNKKNPYIVRPICKDCRIKYELNGYTVDEKECDLPTINLLEHIIDDRKFYKNRNLTEAQTKIIDKLIESNAIKIEYYKQLKTHPQGLKWIIEEYEKIKPGVKKKFIESTLNGRRNFLLNQALNRKQTDKFNTKIVNIKKQKLLSNKDIVKRANNKISVASLNLIIEGKIKPSERLKKVIADALEVKIEDIF